MRVTVVLKDRYVSVDGEGYCDVDLSFLPPNTHALQWYGDYGEVELVDDRGLAMVNAPINSLEPYSQVLISWRQRKAAFAAEQLAKEEELARLAAEKQEAERIRAEEDAQREAQFAAEWAAYEAANSSAST